MMPGSSGSFIRASMFFFKSKPYPGIVPKAPGEVEDSSLASKYVLSKNVTGAAQRPSVMCRAIPSAHPGTHKRGGGSVAPII